MLDSPPTRGMSAFCTLALAAFFTSQPACSDSGDTRFDAGSGQGSAGAAGMAGSGGSTPSGMAGRGGGTPAAAARAAALARAAHLPTVAGSRPGPRPGRCRWRRRHRSGLRFGHRWTAAERGPDAAPADTAPPAPPPPPPPPPWTELPGPVISVQGGAATEPRRPGPARRDGRSEVPRGHRPRPDPAGRRRRRWCPRHRPTPST